MVHLRIVAPERCAGEAMNLLCASDSVLNVIELDERASRPAGVVIMCDVASEDASVVIADLKRLEIHREGSITLEQIDTALSEAARRAERHAKGAPAVNLGAILVAGTAVLSLQRLLYRRRRRRHELERSRP